MDIVSRALAADKQTRCAWLVISAQADTHDHRIEMGCQYPSLWGPLQNLWNDVVRAQAAVPDADEPALRGVIVSLGKLTRNLAADVPNNQKHAYVLEPHIRQLLHTYTAWTRGRDFASFSVTRMLTQALSNIVTANEDLQAQLWEQYMRVPEEKSILIRLLASPDPRTTGSVIVLLTNCIHGSRERGLVLCTTTTGARICVSLLDQLEGFLDALESDDEGKVFELGYALLAILFEQGHFAALYRRMSIADEAVAPPQMTLLKLLDSYVNAGHRPTPVGELAGVLSALFLALSDRAQHAVRQALGALSAASVPPDGGGSTRHAGGPVDMQLPGICAALVLLSQSLVTLVLAEEDSAAAPAPAPSPPSLAAKVARTETLRLLDAFLPRIAFGKPVAASAAPADPRAADPAGFAYLKRDLVRLLGALCHAHRGNQDRVRQCEGIPVVLNLCVVDERNPYLREHAIFALRNLLHANAENQAVVDAIKPMGTWGEDGVLRDTPGAVRR
ncbi:hypothetical protein BV25DRAFT_1806517 [Artomyces pyxidatus]|uniref:Uncharacterized protein n=1 Tax=Artomyces pyxidatus TaxID=48021 RepID=A0ACB8SWX0_9AGAM|nr:hypothetical protein BV25DRAFT_1806517 [Artomyces pyxidatus]